MQYPIIVYVNISYLFVVISLLSSGSFTFSTRFLSNRYCFRVIRLICHNSAGALHKKTFVCICVRARVLLCVCLTLKGENERGHLVSLYVDSHMINTHLKPRST